VSSHSYCLLPAPTNSDAHSDGVLSDPEGSLVIKPCTDTEIDFYKAANAEHATLAYFMPKFLGTLQMNPPASTSTSSATSPAPSVTGIPRTNGGPRFPGRIPSPLNLLRGVGSGGSGGGGGGSSNGTPSIPEHSVPYPAPLSPSQVSLSVPAPRSPLGHRRTPSPTLDPLLRIKGKPLSTDTSIVLSAVTAGFARPNILDLKLGRRLWADDAPPAKRQRLDRVARETTSAPLGFRIAGMRLWQGDAAERPRPPGAPASAAAPTPTVKVTDGATGAEHEDRHFEPETGYLFFNKLYGRRRTAADVKDAFRDYFVVRAAGVGPAQAVEVVRRCRDDVREMLAVLERTETRMYSSSILIVYEGDPEAWSEAKVLRGAEGPGIARAMNGMHVEEVDGDRAGEEEDAEYEMDGEEDEDDDDDEPNTHAVKLIDFAHAEFTPGQGPDENVLHGVRSTVELLEELEAELMAELELEAVAEAKSA